MRFFKITKKEEMESCYIEQSYNEVVETARAWIKRRSENEQILLLDYIISILTEDVCSSGAADTLKKEVSSPFQKCFPCFYSDEENNTFGISTGEKIKVELDSAKIYVCPWNKSRLPDVLIKLSKEPFVFNETEHKSDYYTDINLCHVHNGNHSINVGRYLKKGSIISDLCRTELLYPHCSTDGLYWYNLHTGKKIHKVTDFRLAAIYSVAQIRYSLQNKRQE